MKYRKKPVVIDAWPVTDLLRDVQRARLDLLPREVQDAANASPAVLTYREDGLGVRTLEGMLNATVDDMLVRGIAGEFYPCKRSIFDATYEPVADVRGEYHAASAEPHQWAPGYGLAKGEEDGA